jgi:hypothetical protein
MRVAVTSVAVSATRQWLCVGQPETTLRPSDETAPLLMLR